MRVRVISRFLSAIAMSDIKIKNDSQDYVKYVRMCLRTLQQEADKQRGDKFEPPRPQQVRKNKNLNLPHEKSEQVSQSAGGAIAGEAESDEAGVPNNKRKRLNRKRNKNNNEVESKRNKPNEHSNNKRRTRDKSMIGNVRLVNTITTRSPASAVSLFLDATLN